MHMKTSQQNKRLIAAAITLLAATIFPASLIHSQGTARVIPERRNAKEWLIWFETRAATGRPATPHILLEPSSYPRPRVDSVVDALEQLALTGKSRLVRTQATVGFMRAGQAQDQVPELFERIVAIYRQADGNSVRETVLYFMPFQRNKPAAIAFLKSVITQDPPDDTFSSAPYLAAQSLTIFGASGRAALLELQASGLIRDPHALGFADWFLSKR